MQMPYQALILSSIGTSLAAFGREHPAIAMILFSLFGICMLYKGFLGLTTGTFVDWGVAEYSGIMAKIGSAVDIGLGTFFLVLGIHLALIVLGASGQP